MEAPSLLLHDTIHDYQYYGIVIQVLQYMRTDVRVGGKPVLAVSQEDVAFSLQY